MTSLYILPFVKVFTIMNKSELKFCLHKRNTIETLFYIILHRDNLIPPGPVEDNRDKAPIGKGDRAPIVRHGDNLRAEGEFEKRSVEEFRSAERAVQVKQADHLKLEGEIRYSRYRNTNGLGFLVHGKSDLSSVQIRTLHWIGLVTFYKVP